MSKPPRQSLIEHLGEVPDPRMARTQRHDLLDILAIALCAVIGGADHWTELAEFGQAKRQWFAGFLRLPNGIPSHDTFARVFRLINTEALEQTCHQCLRSVAGRVQGVVAIGGKSVRGARDGKKHPLLQKSAPGPARTAFNWDKSGRPRNPTKSRPSQNHSNCRTLKAASAPSMPWAAKRPSPKRLSAQAPTTCLFSKPIIATCA